jgi:hypothetical protein
MELTSVQKEILSALIGLYRRDSRAIRGEEIAQILRRNPGTIRNQMQSLKALQLVEGVPGPKGGYKATTAAYRELELDTMGEEARVVLVKNDEEMSDVLIEEIDFTTIAHPERCSAAIKLLGNVREFDIGDTVTLGPTPVNRLTIQGTVCGRNDAENKVIIQVSEMISLPKVPVRELASNGLVTVDFNAPLQQVARVLTTNNIYGAPVKRDDQLVGLVTLKDIGKAVAAGKLGSVEDVMNPSLFFVDAETPVYEALRLFQQNNVVFLIVTANGSPTGVITRTDVLRKISPL